MLALKRGGGGGLNGGVRRMKRENGYSWNDSEDSLGRSNMNHVSGLVI